MLPALGQDLVVEGELQMELSVGRCAGRSEHGIGFPAAELAGSSALFLLSFFACGCRDCRDR